jgi:hypothetical protein
MVLACGSGILLDTVEGHLHFQRDFLPIHCKKNSTVSRYIIKSLGLILCERYSDDQPECNSKKLYRPDLGFSLYSAQNCTLSVSVLNTLYSTRWSSRQDLSLFELWFLYASWRMVKFSWNFKSVHYYCHCIGDPSLASDIPLQPSTVRNYFKGTGSWEENLFRRPIQLNKYFLYMRILFLYFLCCLIKETNNTMFWCFYEQTYGYYF